MKLVLLPGLGGDARLFEGQRRDIPEIEVLRWLSPYDQESLAAFSARMAATVAPDEGLFLGGVSFGGMVAFEMVRHLRVRGVFLIGSCSGPEQLPAYATFLSRALRIVPARVYKAPERMRFLFARKFGVVTPQQEELLFQMLLDTPVSFLKWGCQAILAWKPAAPPRIPIWRIHGAEDRLIPASGVHADQLVAGAGHLVNLTHAREVNAFIRARLA